MNWTPVQAKYSSEREKCLEMATECVCKSRESEYGNPENNFTTIAEMWSTYLGKQVTATDVCMMMALLKIARVRTGIGTEDSFIDLAGYAACGMEVARRTTTRLEQMQEIAEE